MSNASSQSKASAVRRRTSARISTSRARRACSYRSGRAKRR